MEGIGFIAAALTSTAFFPQAIKVIKSRQVVDISLAMYVTFVIGLISWIIYGFARHLLSIFICNIITLIPASIILIIKIRAILNAKRMSSEKFMNHP
ncbi:hypothetical protein EWH99_02720 [Sporolactobacillus sp. THM7-7]|nr:hypothetical protein EWH99_02720 [Sporolactobacillus sp. THM7-7]